MMNFCWITLHVKNLESSLAFYHGVLGLPISSRHTGNGVEMAMLGEENQPKIELLQGEALETQPLYAGVAVGIAVESLEDAMEHMKSKQIPIIRGPISPAPHIRFAFVHDPDGCEVQLVETKIK